MAPITTLVITRVLEASIVAVCKVALIAAAGMYARRSGILDSAASRKTLSALTFRVTLPCFLFVSIAAAINSSTSAVARLAPLPLAAFAFVLTGASLGYLVAKITNVRRKDVAAAVIVSSALGNSNNLPVVLAQAIAQYAPQLLGSDDSEQIERQCVAYVGAYLSAFSFLLWSAAPVALRAKDEYHRVDDDDNNDDDDAAATSTGEAVAAAAEVELATVASTGALADMERQTTTATRSPINDTDEERSQRELLPTSTRRPSADITSTGLSPSFNATSSWAASCRSRLPKLPPWVGQAFAPPVLSVLFAVACGLIPAFHKHVIANGGELHVFFAAATTIGQAAIPTSVMLLGAGLAKGPTFRVIKLSTCICIAVARLIVLPMIALGILVTIENLFPNVVPSDPTYRFVFLLQSCTPTANNIIIIATIYADEEVATAIAAAMFTQYCLAPFTLTANLSVFLAYVSR